MSDDAQPSGSTLQIAATFSLHDLTGWVVRRTFHVRNLGAEQPEEALAAAGRIATQVAAEINYITGCGVDAIALKAAGHKKEDLVLGLEPHEAIARFKFALNFKFWPVCVTLWLDGQGRERWPGAMRGATDDWRVTGIRTVNRSASFTLPCAIRHSREAAAGVFVTWLGPRKRGRKTVGWSLTYDHQDAVWNRFLARFHEDGNLAFGGSQYFGVAGKPPTITGSFVKQPKPKPTKLPRKTYLASQPSDATDYVYVIRMGRKNVFKIGKTNDPQGRLLSLQTASPFKLSMFNHFRADNASAAEESLHAALRGCRLEGEWFRLSDQQKEALAAVESFAEGRFMVGDEGLTVEELCAPG